MSATLSHWLRLLWGQAPALHLDSQAPFIAAGAIHLPACPHWLQQRAAAAHAAAHLVYSRAPRGRAGEASTDESSPTGYDVRGLGPIARALLALLEDARAEALACRELPGLARLWQPLHTATPQDGNGFEALMQRLARALADPAYDDPHPWVRKGVGLFYLDAALRLLALRTPAELRVAALRLGHDIGQMRLPFNAKTYRPAPDYRDDHRWMWPADDLAAADLPPPAGGPASHEDDAEDFDSTEPATVTFHPEWDRLIQRLRPAWCRVIEHTAPASAPGPLDSALAGDALCHRLRGPLRALGRDAAQSARHQEGEVFDIDALVQNSIALRARGGSDARVYRVSARRRTHAVVCLLVDLSASSAATAARATPEAPSERSVLQVAARSALSIARALQGMGVACTVAGFRSNGRHAVHVLTVKRPRDAADATLAARLGALRPGGSTRLGAALRHATAACAAVPARHGAARWVLLLSDGEAHDVDVHDPRYLVEDARHAARSAARRSVHVACLALASPELAAARRIFGRRGVQALGEPDALPTVLRRLLG